jgi:nitrate/nitrite transport system substrate-binding protein
MTTMITRRRALAGTAALLAAARALRPAGVFAQSAMTPEGRKATLGYIALTDAAPLIIARERGFFAKHGMPDVEVAKQASWGATRDNLMLGGERGGIDGAHILTPMPYLIHTGKVVQNNQPVPMAILARLNTNGQGISVAEKHKPLGARLDASPLRRAPNAESKVAMTFRGGTHDLWLRYWLAAGIDPDRDVQTIVVPPPQMVANMKVGTMDAFCVGEPWNDQLVNQRLGYSALVTGELWRDHPEKSFAMRGDWVERHPNAAVALTAAVIEAQRWRDEAANKEEMCTILGRRAWFNVPARDILPRARRDRLRRRAARLGKPAADEVLARPRELPLRLARVVVPHRGHPLGRAAGGDGRTRADRAGEPWEERVARRRRAGGRAGGRDAARHQPRARDLLRRQGVRSRRPGRMARRPADQEARGGRLR